MAPCVSSEADNIEEVAALTPFGDFILEEDFVVLAPELSVALGKKLVFELICPSSRFRRVEVVAAR